MKTKKNTIRLTENELKKVIAESVRKILREVNETPNYYICLEDPYDGEMYFWAGTEEDAQYCENSSGCNYIGPISKESAEEWAKRLNAMDYKTCESWWHRLTNDYIEPYESDEEDNFYEHYNSYAINGEDDFDTDYDSEYDYEEEEY